MQQTKTKEKRNEGPSLTLEQPLNADNNHLVRRMVEAAGHTSQSLGIGRVVGQIYAHVFFSSTPQSLDDLTKSLGISKGSASMGVRQLEQWGGLEKLWVKGDRKDYYRARDTFGRIIKNAIVDLIGKRMEISASLLDEVEEELLERKRKNGKQTAEEKFVRSRMKKIREFQKKAQTIWDGFIVKLLKQA